MKTKLNQGQPRRLMYVENQDRTTYGVRARIGWVEFSKSGRTIYYQGLMLQEGKGVRGNFFDVITGEEYWISDVKKRGDNPHSAKSGITVEIDKDALTAYNELKSV